MRHHLNMRRNQLYDVTEMIRRSKQIDRTQIKLCRYIVNVFFFQIKEDNTRNRLVTTQLILFRLDMHKVQGRIFNI